MSLELKKLHSSFNNTNPTKKSAAGYKKRYFMENADLIFDLVENKGVKYPAIIEAIAKDGVVFSYIYFRELMAQEKSKRSALSAGKEKAGNQGGGGQNQSGQQKPSVAANPTRVSEQDDNRKRYLAERERIKSLNISDKEKRELLLKATDEFNKTLKPLAR